MLGFCEAVSEACKYGLQAGDLARARVSARCKGQGAGLQASRRQFQRASGKSERRRRTDVVGGRELFGIATNCGRKPKLAMLGEQSRRRLTVDKVRVLVDAYIVYSHD